jgi:hypothetical protein
MAFWDVVAEHHVRQAVAEYDRLGQDEFLAHYGFGRATAYLLIVDGKAYDSKAILGVAYRLATGKPMGPHDFSGGVQGAAGVLRRLGFDVRNVRNGQRPDPVELRPPGQAAAACPRPRSAPSAQPLRSLSFTRRLTCR